MKSNGKREKIFNAFMSSESFITAYSAMIALFFVPYCARTENYIVAACVPLCFLLPLVLVPTVYALMHRLDLLLFGRYHLVMPLSALLSALFFVVTFGATRPGALGAFMIVIGSAMGVTMASVYRYCSFSVRARTLADNSMGLTVPAAIFAALGIIASVAAFFGYYYCGDGKTVNAAYIVASVAVIFAMAQYLSTYHAIPRLGGKREQSVSAVFKSFYSRLDGRIFASALCSLAAFLTLACMTVYMFFCAGYGGTVTVTAVATSAAAYFAAYAIASLAATRHSRTLTVLPLLCTVTAAALFTLTFALPMQGYAEYACAVCACVLTGMGGALSSVRMRLVFVAIKPRITSGTAFILMRLTESAAMAIALAAGAAVMLLFVNTENMYSFIAGTAIAAALAVAAFISSCRSRNKRETADTALKPEPDADSGAAEPVTARTELASA